MLALVRYLVDAVDKVMANQQIIKTLVVRNGKLATVGYGPELWREWE